MVTTRPLQVAGYCGPGLPNMPLGTMLLPADNEARFEHSRACVQAVLESGEYRYERAAVEPVHTLVDVGVNLGAFTLWATRCWWPGIRQVWGFDPNAEALALAERNVGYTMRGPAVVLCRAAITTDPRPRFETGDNWGGGRTAGVTGGAEVPGVHPRDLPRCDALKVDCEGAEGDLYEAYPHLADVLVTLYEWHGVEQRERCVAACRRAGLEPRVMRDGDGQGQHVWVRHT